MLKSDKSELKAQFEVGTCLYLNYDISQSICCSENVIFVFYFPAVDNEIGTDSCLQSLVKIAKINHISGDMYHQSQLLRELSGGLLEPRNSRAAWAMHQETITYKINKIKLVMNSALGKLYQVLDYCSTDWNICGLFSWWWMLLLCFCTFSSCLAVV